MFVRSPELLVLDDLSSALDVETERQLWERVFELEGVTCLVATWSPWKGLPLGRALYVPLVQSFNHYDADWYTGIARLRYSGPKSTAFLPLHPMLMKAVASVLNISAAPGGRGVGRRRPCR